MSGLQQTGQSNFLTKEDVTALSHYPSLVEVFDDQSGKKFDETRQSLSQTLQSLERIVVRGSREDATEAQTAADAVKVTLNIMDIFRQEQLAQK